MKKKNIIIVSVAAAVILVVGLTVVRLRGGGSATQTESVTATPSPEMVIPTVGSQTTVTVTPANTRHAVIVDVEGIPAGTTSIDYSISYQTKQQGLQGIIGTISLDNGETSYQIKRDLGTCSSGTCVYHDVVGKVTVQLKFTGDYGDKLYEKDFPF